MQLHLPGLFAMLARHHVLRVAGNQPGLRQRFGDFGCIHVSYGRWSIGGSKQHREAKRPDQNGRLVHKSFSSSMPTIMEHSRRPMSLTTNSPLGPYKILSPVGAGGMGEVYKALDTRLHREVAVKVMSAEFASHPDRRARFEREARAVAALNHPNIVAVYDIGNENGMLYSVSELVLGETLRARLGQSPISVREAIDISTQIANGMAAAHTAGITHRDLKPENIMINREGQVKILDFGLARQNDA